MPLFLYILALSRSLLSTCSASSSSSYPGPQALPLLQSNSPQAPVTSARVSLDSTSVESRSFGIRHKFQPRISIPNHLHLSAAVLHEMNCLTSLRLNFLTCELRLVRINSLKAYCEVWIPFASICVSTLLTGFPVLFISNTNDLIGHLTWLMPPSLNLPFPRSHGRCCLVSASQFLSQQPSFSPDLQD